MIQQTSGLDNDQRVDRFEQALLSLNRLEARRVLDQAVQPDQNPLQFVEQIVVPALERIGKGWEEGSVALSQVYMSGRICEELVDASLPPGSLNRRNQPPMAIATLEDHHLLGKRIVYSLLRASGFQLLDYGRVTAEEIIWRAQQDGIRLLLISTLMLPSALRVSEVRKGLERAGWPAKIIVGGAPFRFDEQLWQDVGADAMGRRASEVVQVIDGLIGGTP